MAAMQTRVRWRASEDLSPVGGQIFDVPGADVMRERVIELGVFEAPLMKSRRHRQERRGATGEIVDRWSRHGLQLGAALAGADEAINDPPTNQTTKPRERGGS